MALLSTFASLSLSNPNHTSYEMKRTSSYKRISIITLLLALCVNTYAGYYGGNYYGLEKNDKGHYRSLSSHFDQNFEAQALVFVKNAMRLKKAYFYFYSNPKMATSLSDLEEPLGFSLSNLEAIVTYIETCLETLAYNIDILTQGDATFIHEAMEDNAYPAISRSGLYCLIDDLQAFTTNPRYQKAVQKMEDPIPSTISSVKTCFIERDSDSCFNVYDKNEIPFSQLPY